MLVDNATNRPLRLYDLMDFNKAFQSYDTLEGANCLTCGDGKSQREAAIEAVKEIGLNQIKEIDKQWFSDAAVGEMFQKRLNMLKSQVE